MNPDPVSIALVEQMRAATTGDWTRMSFDLRTVCRRDGRELALIVGGVSGFFMAGALEAEPKSWEQSPDHVGEHAHKMIGHFKKADAARRAAMRYARTWKRQSARSKACPCKPIRGRRAA